MPASYTASVPKLGLNEGRKRHQVQDKVERQHPPEEGERETEDRPEIEVLPAEV